MIKAYARASALLSLEAGIAKHCLGTKSLIYHFGNFSIRLCFTTKVPFQFPRAHVHDAPQHLVTFAIDICSQNLIIVPIFTSLCQNFQKSEDSHIARALHVHSAPRHPVSWTNEKHSLNCISMPSFASLDQSFPKVKVPVQIHSARA